MVADLKSSSSVKQRPATTPPPPSIEDSIETGTAPAIETGGKPAIEAVETWQTRPESIGAFLGNLLLCTLFPFVALWYGPKYVMRHEYLKAFVCVAVPLVLLSVFVLA